MRRRTCTHSRPKRLPIRSYTYYHVVEHGSIFTRERGGRTCTRFRPKSWPIIPGFHCFLSQQRFYFCFETFFSRLLSRWAALLYYHVIEHGSMYIRGREEGGPARVQDQRACRPVTIREYTSMSLNMAVYICSFIYICIYEYV